MAGNSREAKQQVAALASELGFTPVDAGPLENTRLVETMGDMIRYLIAGTKLGSTTALSVQVLPTTNTKRLGGRVDSKFAKHQSK
jgi:predicted dinucleotide-binding enzyme